MSGAAGEDGFGRALTSLGAAVLAALRGLEWAARRLHPPAVPGLRARLGPVRDRLEEALEDWRAVAAPEGLEAFRLQLEAAAVEALEALRGFVDAGPPATATARILESIRRHCRAQEQLYPLRSVLAPFGQYFVEAPLHGRLDVLDPDPPPRCGGGVGLHRAGSDADPATRGGFSLYVPEWLDDSAPRPVVVALHGGSGHGRDFLWTWLREARGRGFVLLAPTSVGPTWSLDAPAVDATRLRSMLDWVAERWPIDPSRILLTGLSDGATFSLLAGLEEGAPYTALAPVSGVLHPLNLARGNLGRALGRRIYLVHGALDWLFPIRLAQLARDELERAGADLVYRELEDLSHTYPREENARILEWFDPTLGLPETQEGS
jgi:phospholipase/carboxylesterase